jgi:hypothetical protein
MEAGREAPLRTCRAGATALHAHVPPQEGRDHRDAGGRMDVDVSVQVVHAVPRGRRRWRGV